MIADAVRDAIRLGVEHAKSGGGMAPTGSRVGFETMGVIPSAPLARLLEAAFDVGTILEREGYEALVLRRDGVQVECSAHCCRPAGHEGRCGGWSVKA